MSERTAFEQRLTPLYYESQETLCVVMAPIIGSVHTKKLSQICWFDSDVCYVGSLCEGLAFIHETPFELSKLYSGMLLTTHRKPLPMLQSAIIQ